MEQFVQVVEQISEAVRCLKRETLVHARIALLLLDNSVEILMHRFVINEISHDDLWVKLRDSAQSSMPVNIAERFIKASGHVFISDTQRKAVTRWFIPKVDFLVDRKHVDPIIGDIIKSLHRYRNDASHRDKIRKATIHAAATIYLEIACDLLVSLPSSGTTYSSNDDWSGFFKTYGLNGPLLDEPQDIQKIAEQLRQEVGLDSGKLAAMLSGHLISRLDAIQSNLEFVSGNAGSKATPEENLLHVQFAIEHSSTPLAMAKMELESYTPKYPIGILVEWRRSATAIASKEHRGKLELLKQFCNVEQKMEPLETMIENTVVEIERAIQVEIDISLGK